MTDILVDPDSLDLLCQDGDLVLGDATYQHQADLLAAQEGEYKQYPTTGVGLFQFLNDEDKGAMVRRIRSEFSRDGMRIDKVTAGTEIRIRAQYK